MDAALAIPAGRRAELGADLQADLRKLHRQAIKQSYGVRASKAKLYRQAPVRKSYCVKKML